MLTPPGKKSCNKIKSSIIQLGLNPTQFLYIQVTSVLLPSCKPNGKLEEDEER